MPHITVLDQNTINKIAAGEVIERPASVVKELLENAIDAKATAVTVEIRDGGISFIRVTDNGCGIPPEEVATAFLSHTPARSPPWRTCSPSPPWAFVGRLWPASPLCPRWR